MLRQNTLTTVFFIALASSILWIPAFCKPSSPLRADSTLVDSINSTQIKHPKVYDLFLKQFGIILDDHDPLELYSFVARWLRVPYRFGGLSRKGVDCQGFVRVIYDSLYCYNLPAGAGSQYQVCDAIPKDSLRTGDLVFFCIGTRSISHVGIYLKDGWFAHATVSGVGVVLSRLDAPYYRRWFYRAGRVRLIEPGLSPLS